VNIGALLRPQWVRPHLRADSPEAAIDALSAALEQTGTVAPSFAAAVREREKQFPTGLPTPGIKVALPHTDAVHVHQSAVAVATLSAPIPFHVMGSPEETVAVEVIFLLAIAEPTHQVDALAQLIGLIQQDDVLAALLAATDGETICRIVAEAAAGTP